VSHDGGKSWQDLVQPNFLISTQFADFDPASGEPLVTPQLAAGAGNRLHLVQFHTPIVPEYRTALEAAGAEISTFMAFQSFLVRMDAAAAQKVAGLEFVRFIGDYHPAYRLDPQLIAGLAGGAPMADARYNIVMVNYKVDAPACRRRWPRSAARWRWWTACW
jgi:hypothetical protein